MHFNSSNWFHSSVKTITMNDLSHAVLACLHTVLELTAADGCAQYERQGKTEFSPGKVSCFYAFTTP